MTQKRPLQTCVFLEVIQERLNVTSNTSANVCFAVFHQRPSKGYFETPFDISIHGSEHVFLFVLLVQLSLKAVRRRKVRKAADLILVNERLW